MTLQLTDDRETSVGTADRHLAHQRELVVVWVGEFRQPQFRRRRSMDDVRVCLEAHALSRQRGMHFLDVAYAEIDRGAPLRRLTRRWNPDQEPDRATHEKGHLRWRRKQERKTQNVTIEGDAALKIVDRDQKLADGRGRKIHFGHSQPNVPAVSSA